MTAATAVDSTVAETVTEAQPSGGAKDRAVTAASAVFPPGAKVCWCGDTSREKSVDVEQ